jgi:hypothetical protein
MMVSNDDGMTLQSDLQLNGETCDALTTPYLDEPHTEHLQKRSDLAR